MAGLLRRNNDEDYSVEGIQRLQERLDRRAFRRMARKLRLSPTGRHLLEVQARVWDDAPLERLRSLPEGSLGREVAAFLDGHGYAPHEDCVAARVGADAATEYAKYRHRATHDIRHVLLGLGASPEEEILVHAFQLGQEGQWVSRIVVALGLLKHGLFSRRPLALARLAFRCWWAGRRASFTLNTAFEDRWDTPVDALRRELQVPRMDLRAARMGVAAAC